MEKVERGSAEIVYYAKLVHQKYFLRSPAKVSGFLLRLVFLLAHHSTKRPRITPGSTNVPDLPRSCRVGLCKTFSVHTLPFAFVDLNLVLIASRPSSLHCKQQPFQLCNIPHFLLRKHLSVCQNVCWLDPLRPGLNHILNIDADIMSCLISADPSRRMGERARGHWPRVALWN